jgi:ATPase subunit of ABC transporter with duplicated ATPase domains
LLKIHKTKVRRFETPEGLCTLQATMIETKNLTFRYGPEAPEMRFPDLDCAAGERLLLLGSSGAGKTTLFRILAGDLEPDTGRVVRPSGCTIGLLAQEVGDLGDAALLEFEDSAAIQQAPDVSINNA